MTSVDCKLCRENIHSYLRGYLSKEEKEEVEAHLKSCFECRREVEQEQALTAIMDAWKVPKAGRAFEVCFTARLVKEKNRLPGWLRRLFLLS